MKYHKRHFITKLGKYNVFYDIWAKPKKLNVCMNVQEKRVQRPSFLVSHKRPILYISLGFAFVQLNLLFHVEQSQRISMEESTQYAVYIEHQVNIMVYYTNCTLYYIISKSYILEINCSSIALLE